MALEDKIAALDGNVRKIADFISDWYKNHDNSQEVQWFRGYIMACTHYNIITEEEQDTLEEILAELAA